MSRGHRTAAPLHCLIFLAAFLAACAMIGRGTCYYNVAAAHAKFAYFAGHRDEYDTVFIGSSHVGAQISPAIFDETMKAHGQATKAFNLGLEMMLPPESYYLAQRLLALRPKKLKWVFIETADISLRSDQNRATLRMTYWHDWKQTQLVCREIALSKSPTRLAEITAHLRLFLNHLVNVGAAHHLLAASLQRGESEAELEKRIGPSHDGFRPALATMSEGDQAATFEKLVTLMMGSKARAVRLHPPLLEGMRDLARAITRAGATPIFINTPVTESRTWEPILREKKIPAILLEFNKREAYANFYDPSRRADFTHLNLAGAREFSEAVGNEFAAALSQRNR